MSGLLNYGQNELNPNLPDTSGRILGTSFPAQSAYSAQDFHHAGTIQGLNDMHRSFDIQGTHASRNSTMSFVPSSAAQPPTGSLSNGRFASDNIPTALFQMSHGSSQGHSGFTNRGGIGVSPLMGNVGARVASSMDHIVGRGNIGRGSSSGAGLSAADLASLLTLAGNTGSGNLSLQGPRRGMDSGLPQAPQMMSMLGNSYSNSGGLSQSQAQPAKNSLSPTGMFDDMNSSYYSPFDINDFPRLTGRPSSAGGPKGQLGSLLKQGVGPIDQQNQEFSIQSEDFPALPGFKGGNNEYATDFHHKEQLDDNGGSMLQSQHFSMGRSSGFSSGGTYSSHHQQQRQQQHAPSVSSSGVLFSHANNEDPLHLHSFDKFPASHASYHSQVQNSGLSSIGLRSVDTRISGSAIGSYDQPIQPYQQLQQQSQFRLHQISAVNQSYREQNLKSLQSTQPAPDRYGLLGLLSVIRLSDPELSSLALGIDLTTLGLDLNSMDDLHKKFGSPWSDEPAKGEPEYKVPECYYAKQPPVLQQGYFLKFPPETLFYIFYSMPRDEAQLYAANELYTRGWFYHKEFRIWLTRVANMEPLVKTSTYERASYLCFDPNKWETVQKDNFVLHYEMLEKRPMLPPQH